MVIVCYNKAVSYTHLLAYSVLYPFPYYIEFVVGGFAFRKSGDENLLDVRFVGKLSLIHILGMNILTPSENHCKMVRLNHPILNNAQLDILCLLYTSIVNGKLYMSSFYSHRLRKIPRLVHIHSLAHGNVIGK